MKNKILPGPLVFIAGILLLQSCKDYHIRSNYKEANALLHETDTLQEKPFLKAHLHNGNVYILRKTWQVDTVLNTVTGNGECYDFNRVQLNKGFQSIPIDSVAIFETNLELKNTESERISALAILTAANVALTTFCITNPKACFGSCPTFYINEEDHFHYADAEGFSNAIAPSLEYGDIDALNAHLLSDQTFSLTLKNEALETHCLKQVELWAYPLNENQRVYQTRTNDFYLCSGTYTPGKVTAPEGDITHLLNQADRNERFSLADAENLSSKEEIYIDFENGIDPDDLGLVIHFRQSLMTTYFIYSAMGYMGDEVGDIFARIEREKELKATMDNGLQYELGELEVHLWNENTRQWELQHSVYETGPIAINRQVVPLESPGVENKESLKLKLVLNKGLWRIDYVALTHCLQKVEPLQMKVDQVLKKNKAEATALKALYDQDQYFITYPGDQYTLNFRIPEAGKRYELFLFAEGYYLEWMRENWLKEKNLFKLWQMFERPRSYLKSEASAYKEHEKTMEEQFWNSKIEPQNLSLHE